MRVAARNLLAFVLAIIPMAKATDIPPFQDNMLAVCLNTANVSYLIIRGDPRAVALVEQKTDIFALELSNPLPQSYNAVKAGITSALDQHRSSHNGSSAKAPHEIRAAVLGLWCVNDVIAAMSSGAQISNQSAEIQQKLVDGFAEAIRQHNE